MMPSPYSRIYAQIRRIPRGRIATYGQIASLAGHARQVGYALSALPDGSTVPWHRVINARGEVSLRTEPDCDDGQRRLLESEGVAFGPQGRVALSRFRWRPREWSACESP